MGSGGIGATLLYDWEMDERRPATSVEQLLPSVWWDVTREGLAHSLGHRWASAFCLVGWGGGGVATGGEGNQRVTEQLLCVYTKLSVTHWDHLHEEAAHAPKHPSD